MKIKVENFENLVVITTGTGKDEIKHGGEHCSRVPVGVIASREPVTFVRVHLFADFTWLDDIIHKDTGETLRQYRKRSIEWERDYSLEPEFKAGYAEASVDPASPSGDVSASIIVSLPVSSEPPTTIR